MVESKSNVIWFYKDDDYESEDDSANSGEDESQVSEMEIETESEGSNTPVKVLKSFFVMIELCSHNNELLGHERYFTLIYKGVLDPNSS